MQAAGQRSLVPVAAIVTVSLAGHARPAMAVAAAICERGFRVEFFVTTPGISADLRDMERRYELFNIQEVKSGRDFIKDMHWGEIACSKGGYGGSKLCLFEHIVKLNTPEKADASFLQYSDMIQQLKILKPQVVITDHSQMVIQTWAESSCIPSIILHTPYFFTGSPTGCAKMTDEQVQQMMSFLEEKQPMAFATDMMKRLDIAAPQLDDNSLPEGAEGARKASGMSPHTFVFCEPELLHVDLRDMPDRTHVVGPCLTDSIEPVGEALKSWLDDAAANGARVLYVALGTLANDFINQPSVPEQLLASFSQLGSSWRVLWSLPKAQQSLVEGKLDSNVRVESFVPQRAVLAHPAVRVFFTHCGQSSANESIFAGVPMVGMPLFCDQFEMADSIERHGLGLFFDKDVLRGTTSGPALEELVLRVEAEPSFKSNTSRHQCLMRMRRGGTRAADVVESIVLVGADYQELYRSKVCTAETDSPLPTLLNVRTKSANFEKATTGPEYSTAAISSE
eukprot:TRINITY_DN3558_c0_g1_i1.p1 TRINITY_DN3558_c0_g1~~TRINITY_DN3558_c0_g1_i1.p1  ORF type:complete len:509 (-),score=102.69 TRINITY_DN3558_c0_g1_i1:248-1774(-)